MPDYNGKDDLRSGQRGGTNGWMLPAFMVFLIFMVGICVVIMEFSSERVLQKNARDLEEADMYLKAINMYVTSLPEGEEKKAAKAHLIKTADRALALMRSYRHLMHEQGYKEGDPGTKELPAPSSFAFTYSLLAIKHAPDPE